MKTYNVALLLVLAVFNGVRYTEQVNVVYDWEVVTLDDGTIIVTENGKTYDESVATLIEMGEHVIFSMFENINDDACTVKLGDKNALFNCGFDPTRETRIIIHGWNNGLDSEMCTSIRDAYLKTGKYNVIVAHWEKWASQNYISARMKVAPTGEYVGLFIDFLNTNGMDGNKLIVVGHSLGAHIAGVACRNTTANVAVLIGLDPAGPLFTPSMNAMITKHDAQRVVALHTSAHKLGCKESVGDIDFWPNGGSKQPGCGLDLFAICAHGRAYQYWAEDILSGMFTVYPASSYKNFEARTYTGDSMSLDDVISSSDATGDYYFNTNSESPYSKG